MLKVRITNKFFLVGLVGLALALMTVGPITFLHLCTTFVWWEITLLYIMLILPALIGLLLLVGVWGTFDMNTKEATKN
jgi:hypothetical protein